MSVIINAGKGRFLTAKNTPTRKYYCTPVYPGGNQRAHCGQDFSKGRFPERKFSKRLFERMVRAVPQLVVADEKPARLRRFRIIRMKAQQPTVP